MGLTVTDYANREWLLDFLAENRREAARLRNGTHPQFERHLKKVRQARTKPWPRRSGLTSAFGAPLMWRP